MLQSEIPLLFNCQNDQLLAIIHQAKNYKPIGVLIVVGGPQYRVGSHRQFVLLARKLAEQNIAVMRFDHRGIGNSSGKSHGFDDLQEDIHNAINSFMQQCPELSGVVIWGLCDAASAALFYSVTDVRVKGLILLNPWVYTEQSEAKTTLKYYYIQRLCSRDFWSKIMRFKFNYRESLSSLIRLCLKLIPNLKVADSNIQKRTGNGYHIEKSTLPERMFECLISFQYPVLFILSGHDFTADQFRELVKSDPQWRQLLADNRVTQRQLAEADHTFSSAIWRDQVAEWTWLWLCQIERESLTS